MDEEIKYLTDAMLHQAVESIDSFFSQGYAERNPELVSAFLIAASNNNIAASNNKT